MVTPSAQSDGRTPHPENSAGSNTEPISWVLPNRKSVELQKSIPSLTPPIDAREVPCAFRFVNTHWGMKSPLSSSQVRATDGGKIPPPPPTIRSAGLALYARLLTLAPCRYLPRFTFSAVLPLPKRS